MKNGQPKRGKNSSFLKSLKRKGNSSSEIRQIIRHKGEKLVSSTKMSIHALRDSQLYVANKYKRRMGRKGIVIDKPLVAEKAA
jgi:hypothetical protein